MECCSCSPKNKALCILGALVLAILIGLGGYFLGLRSANPKSSIPTPTPTPTIIQDETTNWKTYINDKYHYSIKYPTDYSYFEQSQDYVRFVKGSYDPNLPQSETYFSIQAEDNSRNRCTSDGIFINSPNAIVYCRIMPNNERLLFSEILYGNEPPEFIKNTFDQILSTFKFLD